MSGPRNVDNFIDGIVTEVCRGFAFVPFIGAGFSAPSGVPVIGDLSEYLQWCIFIALGAEQKDDRGSMHQAWNPKTDRWPPLAAKGARQPRGHWSRALFERIGKMRGEIEALGMETATLATRQQREDLVRKLDLYDQAYGAMPDWRSALQFLSRLERGNRTELPQLKARDQKVVDSFFREVLRGRYPTLGHRMLGVLAGPLHIDVLLTTNFDDLIEQAFEIARNPLQVFEITPYSPLPTWSSIRPQRSIVKLHGGRLQLRADYTLDDELTQEEKDHYLTYFLSGEGKASVDQAKAYARSGKSGNPLIRRHLLVMGCSSSDERIWSWICYAAEQLGSDFKVFWVCYSERDYDDVTEKLRKANLSGRFYLLRHTQQGLLLLQLYQRLRGTIPPLGGIFPSSARLTLPPFENPSIWSNWVQNNANVQELEQNLRNDLVAAPKARVFIVTSEPAVPGTTTVCARIFRSLETSGPGMIPIWIDLSAVSSTDNLFEVLIESIYYRLGVEDWIPSTIGRSQQGTQDYGHQSDEVRRLVESVDKTWVIFLNAREYPGANVGFEPEGTNGWLDDEHGEDSACWSDFVRFIEAIVGKTDVCKIVVLARQATSGTARSFTSPDFWTPGVVVPHTLKGTGNDSVFDAKGVAADCLAWIEKVPDERDLRARFLYGLVLMQRPRHPAFVLSNGMNPKHLPKKTLDQWVVDLVECGLVRYQDGGMIWVHSTCRGILRSELKRRFEILLRQQCAQGLPNRDALVLIDPAEIHRRLGEWYESVIDASESPVAIFEAADHFCKSAEGHWEAASEVLKSFTDDQAIALDAQTRLFEACSQRLSKCSAMLEAAGATIRTNSFLIQTHGYSRGSCRRLEALAKAADAILRQSALFKGSKAFRTLECLSIAPELIGTAKDRLADVEKNIGRLVIDALELMRAIAREVGEDAKAFQRHRQVAHYTLGRFTGESYNEALRRSKDMSWEESLAVRLRQSGGLAKAQLWRWSRWTAMLSISSRSYDKARRTLEHPANLGPFGEQDAYEEKGHYRELTSQSERVEFLRLVEQATELCLLQLSTLYRWLPYGGWLPDVGGDVSWTDVPTILASAKALVERGRRLATKVRDQDLSTDGRDVVIANWCETRLLIHQSAIGMFERRLTDDEPGHGPQAQARLEWSLGTLSDAEAKLRVSNPQRVRSELALIDLYRAEAYLAAAGTHRLGPKTEGRSRCVVDFLSAPQFPRVASSDHDWRDAFRDRQWNDERVLSTYAQHAIRFLDRSEIALRLRRRNVWWTTWFFERKLRAIALSVLASCGQPGAPIPYLGLEAAMRHTVTEAEELMRAAIRTIRVDAYRMATIVESYFSCILALILRLNVDDTPRLPDRMTRMEACLDEGLAALDEICLARLSGAGKTFQPDEIILRYIETVRDSIKQCRDSEAYRHLLAHARYEPPNPT
jgi:hypothetical protein